MKTILFDADGVLFNNEEGIINGVLQALAAFGISVDRREELRCFIGPPLSESFPQFFGLSAEQTQEAIRIYRAFFADIGVYQSCLYDGVPEMLAALRQADCFLAVASSKPEVFVRRILRKNKLEDAFDCIVAADLTGSLEKKADVIREALRRTGASSADTIMVGDRKYDAEGAEQNGVPFVAALYGFGSPEEFAPYPMLGSADSPADLTKLLLSF